jgi:hypothetical protein
MSMVYEQVFVNGVLTDSDEFDCKYSIPEIIKCDSAKMPGSITSLTPTTGIICVRHEEMRIIHITSNDKEMNIEKHLQYLKSRIDWISSIMYTLSVEFDMYSIERASLQKQYDTIFYFMQVKQSPSL